MQALSQDFATAPVPVAIPVSVSARHVHLTAEVIEALFCDQYRLHPTVPASQSRQYLSRETVTLIGPTGRRMRGVMVIGPPRAMNQIEISRTDAQMLGIAAPVRESGDLIGTPGILIEGPRSQVRLVTGVICAQRHIHLSPAEALPLSLHDGDRVAVSTFGAHRETVFKNVLVRVAADYRFELHLDSDEADAAGVSNGGMGVLHLDRGFEGSTRRP